MPTRETLPATPPEDRFWLILREPKCVPERKGAFALEHMAITLRAVMAARPTAYITVVTVDADGTPEVQDGPECLQMLDGRSMTTGWRHIRSSSAAHATDAPFQDRVAPWMKACFGRRISRNRRERNHRFLEEAIQLVAYVYGRPDGEPSQEVGGVMVTLAALCLAAGMDMHQAGETELARIWTKVEQIRAKQAAKPKHSPLPQHVPAGSGSTRLDVLIAATKAQGPRTEGEIAAQRANWAAAEMRLDRKQDRKD